MKRFIQSGGSGWRIDKVRICNQTKWEEEKLQGWAKPKRIFSFDFSLIGKARWCFFCWMGKDCKRTVIMRWFRRHATGPPRPWMFQTKFPTRTRAYARILLKGFIPFQFHPSLFIRHQWKVAKGLSNNSLSFCPFRENFSLSFSTQKGWQCVKNRGRQSTPVGILEYSPRNTPVLLWQYSSTAPRVLEYCRESTRVLSAKYWNNATSCDYLLILSNEPTFYPQDPDRHEKTTIAFPAHWSIMKGEGRNGRFPWMHHSPLTTRPSKIRETVKSIIWKWMLALADKGKRQSSGDYVIYRAVSIRSKETKILKEGRIWDDYHK